MTKLTQTIVNTISGLVDLIEGIGKTRMIEESINGYLLERGMRKMIL